MVAAPDGSIYLSVELCQRGVPEGRDVFVGVQLNDQEKQTCLRAMEHSLFEVGVGIMRHLAKPT